MGRLYFLKTRSEDKVISDFTKNAVPQLVQHELEFSKNQHEERFHSLHEAESVIREELEELEEDVQDCRQCFENLHASTRQDDMYGAIVNANHIASFAIYAAYEAIQLAAMCEKLLETNAEEHETN